MLITLSIGFQRPTFGVNNSPLTASKPNRSKTREAESGREKGRKTGGKRRDAPIVKMCLETVYGHFYGKWSFCHLMANQMAGASVIDYYILRILRIFSVGDSK